MVDPKKRPFTLSARSTDALAQYIKDGKAKKIVVLVGHMTRPKQTWCANATQTGAGISTSAGIPDFRSPETGLYANLERLNLPHPEAVFELSFFRENPLPFYTLAQELYPGKYRPTITHSFINLLHKKGLLLKLFTQNIDCLEREAGVPSDKIIEAHGSFAEYAPSVFCSRSIPLTWLPGSQACIDCKKSYPKEQMLTHIENKTVPRCIDSICNGLVKPKIVFFGEQLPREFFDNIDLVEDADLCIILGTSLSVHPFASLPQQVDDAVPRLLINMEQVGTLGSRPDDVLILKDCDTGVKELAAALDWSEQLEELWAATKKDGQFVPGQLEKVEKSRDDLLQDEVEKLTQDIDKTLKIGKDQQKWLDDHVPSATHQAKEDTLQPRADADSRTLAPLKKGSESGLAHIFPFLSSDNKGDGSNL